MNKLVFTVEEKIQLLKVFFSSKFLTDSEFVKHVKKTKNKVISDKIEKGNNG